MVPLSQCPQGSKVRIVSLCEDARCRCRLCALGLTPGVEAEVREGGDSCRVSVRGGEVCLGSGLAGRVMVTPV
jgi:ferrous iron transport protein A